MNGVADELSAVEAEVVAAAQNGGAVDLRTGDDELDDPSRGAAWGAERTLRASVLADVLTGRLVDRPRAVIVLGARVVGTLDLTAVEVACPLALHACHLDSVVELVSARMPRLTLGSCWLPGVLADDLECRGSVHLGGSTLGALHLDGASIGGMLDLAHVVLGGAPPPGERGTAERPPEAEPPGSGPREAAPGEATADEPREPPLAEELQPPRAREDEPADGEDAPVRDVLAADAAPPEPRRPEPPPVPGPPRSPGSGASAPDPGVPTDAQAQVLRAHALHVKRDLNGSGLVANGEIWLHDARIEGQIVLVGAHLTATGHALNAERLRIGGGLYLTERFAVDGALRLLGAHIGGQLVLSDGRLTSPEDIAVHADGIVVDGDLRLSDVSVTGELRLVAARVGGEFGVLSAKLTSTTGAALAASGIAVGESAYLHDVDARGALVLARGKVAGDVSVARVDVEEPAFSLSFDRLTVGGDAAFEQVDARSGISLAAAHVCGRLGMEGVEARAAEGRPALHANDLRIDGDFTLTGVVVTGGMQLIDARIGGQTVFSGASLGNPGAAALHADRATFVGSVAFIDGSEAHGETRLAGASVGGQLRFVGGKLANAGAPALAADGIKVGSDLRFDPPFAVEGEMRLTAARVTGEAVFDRVELSNPGRVAVLADGFVVEENLGWNGGAVRGALSLAGAKVTGRVVFRGASITHALGTGLGLAEATIGGSLWLLFARPMPARLDLTGARVSTIYDSETTWPRELALAGCSYDQVVGVPPLGPKGRIRWLARERDYMPQSYEHLREVYRRAGDDAAARRVGVAGQRRRRRGRGPLGKVAATFMDVVIAYGYRPWQAAFWLVGIALAAWPYFASAHPDDFVPGRAGTPRVPFEPFIYTLDVLLPIIDFGQERAWPAAGAAQWWAFGLGIAGWVLSTALVAGVTGVLRRG